MCGRFVNAEVVWSEYRQYLDMLSGTGEFALSFNISPGGQVPVIARNKDGVPTCIAMRWGLHPSWSKGPPAGRPLFNARVETVASKPSFRSAYKRRRCLVPFNGWYEWTGDSKPKTPFYIYPDGTEPPFAFAGLWEMWKQPDETYLLSFTILTADAEGPIKDLHHRMPIRLPKSVWSDWLDPEADPAIILECMLRGDDLAFHEVSKAVSSGRSEGPELVVPVAG